MIYLCDGEPTSKVEGDKIAIAIPSGGSTITIALSFTQARRLAEITIREANRAIDEANRTAPPSAEIIAFPREIPAPARRERLLRDAIRIVRVNALEARDAN